MVELLNHLKFMSTHWNLQKNSKKTTEVIRNNKYSKLFHLSFSIKSLFNFFLTRSFFCVYTKADIPLFALCLENNGRLPYKSWHVILIETFIIHILAIASSSWCNRNSFLEWKHMTLIEKEIQIDIFSPN
jgi:hypothetical protein